LARSGARGVDCMVFKDELRALRSENGYMGARISGLCYRLPSPYRRDQNSLAPERTIVRESIETGEFVRTPVTDNPVLRAWRKIACAESGTEYTPGERAHRCL
jgi:hypothetical protein